MVKPLIAALDIGKTHSRLTLFDPEKGSELWCARRHNRSTDSSLVRQLDVAGTEEWLINTFREAPERERVAAVVPIAHGAAVVLVDENGELLVAPDYEDPRFEAVNEDYERERDPFALTCSPSLPLGLNLGRQLFYLEARERKVFARARHALLYPQFWAWRLSGAMTSEVSSLGCHSDLWLPHAQTFSGLAQRRRWSPLFPPNRFAGEPIGNATGPIGTAAGLPPGCRVLCGIHDSNASYLRHLPARRDRHFAVISSGTWTVVMANGGRLDRLRAEHDMLANVDAFGSPVATARFMGGREYEAIARTDRVPTVAACKAVMDRAALALPSFANGGPFASRAGRLIDADGLDGPERAALATLYLALMSEWVIEALGVEGDIIIDGPLATNPLFPGVLASLCARRRILVEDGPRAHTAIMYLAGVEPKAPTLKTIAPIELHALTSYRCTWRERIQPVA